MHVSRPPVTNGPPLVTPRETAVVHPPADRGGPTFPWENVRRSPRTIVHSRTYTRIRKREFNYPRLTVTYDGGGAAWGRARAIVSRANLWDSGNDDEPQRRGHGVREGGVPVERARRRQRRKARRREQGTDVGRDPRPPHPLHQGHRQQRVPAEREEVVVGADAVHAEQIAHDGGQPRLGRRLGIARAFGVRGVAGAIMYG